MRRKFNRLYIHVPFCESKCGYCAFYSLPHPSDDAIDAYLDHLIREFETAAERCDALRSIFLGGGTPTILSPIHLRRLFEGISANFAVVPSAEISIECNPETLTRGKAEVIAEFTNRVSLGVQSFNLEILNLLERKGTPANFTDAITILSELGVKNLGCDLIYAVPGETLDIWRSDLAKAADCGVNHVSAYSLTIEEGSRLFDRIGKVRESREVENDALDAEMWRAAAAILADAEIRRYEVSNYAIPGNECRHNLEIWYGDTYIGCGPAAASFDGVDRWTNPANLADWLKGEPVEVDAISAERRAAELLAMGLRTTNGWDSAKFADRTGFSLDFRKRELAILADDGLLRINDDGIAPTDYGIALWDDIAETLLL